MVYLKKRIVSLGLGLRVSLCWQQWGCVGGGDSGFGFCLFVLYVGFVGLVLRAEKSITSGNYSW